MDFFKSYNNFFFLKEPYRLKLWEICDDPWRRFEICIYINSSLKKKEREKSRLLIDVIKLYNVFIFP